MIKDGPTQTCFACPTVFEFTDTDDTEYYFRLRHGYAVIAENDGNGRVLASDSFGDGDGVCSWNQVVIWAASKGVTLIMEEDYVG